MRDGAFQGMVRMKFIDSFTCSYVSDIYTIVNKMCIMFMFPGCQ